MPKYGVNVNPSGLLRRSTRPGSLKVDFSICNNGITQSRSTLHLPGDKPYDPGSSTEKRPFLKFYINSTTLNHLLIPEVLQQLLPRDHPIHPTRPNPRKLLVLEMRRTKPFSQNPAPGSHDLAHELKERRTLIG